MMLPINLTRKELQEVTGRKKASAQIKWLQRQGFTVMPRADGTPLVSRIHFEAVMGGKLYQSKTDEIQPDFSSF